jgi:hypothetical protein
MATVTTSRQPFCKTVQSPMSQLLGAPLPNSQP